MTQTTFRGIDTKKAAHLLLSLGTLLRNPPSTFLDDAPSANWIETVDKLTREVIVVLGGSDAVTVAIRAMVDLMPLMPEAEAFAAEQVGWNTQTWRNILSYAKFAKPEIERLYAAMQTLESEASAKVRTLEVAVMQQMDEILLLRADVETLQLRLTMTAETKPSAPGRGDTSSGIKIIDMGD